MLGLLTVRLQGSISDIGMIALFVV